MRIGGEGGIRTLDTGLSQYNGLANRRFRPLSHLSVMGRLSNASCLLAANTTRKLRGLPVSFSAAPAIQTLGRGTGQDSSPIFASFAPPTSTLQEEGRGRRRTLLRNRSLLETDDKTVIAHKSVPKHRGETRLLHPSFVFLPPFLLHVHNMFVLM